MVILTNQYICDACMTSGCRESSSQGLGPSSQVPFQAPGSAKEPLNASGNGLLEGPLEGLLEGAF